MTILKKIKAFLIPKAEESKETEAVTAAPPIPVPEVTRPVAKADLPGANSTEKDIANV